MRRMYILYLSLLSALQVFTPGACRGPRVQRLRRLALLTSSLSLSLSLSRLLVCASFKSVSLSPSPSLALSASSLSLILLLRSLMAHSFAAGCCFFSNIQVLSRLLSSPFPGQQDLLVVEFIGP